MDVRARVPCKQLLPLTFARNYVRVARVKQSVFGALDQFRHPPGRHSLERVAGGFRITPHQFGFNIVPVDHGSWASRPLPDDRQILHQLHPLDLHCVELARP